MENDWYKHNLTKINLENQWVQEKSIDRNRTTRAILCNTGELSVKLRERSNVVDGEAIESNGEEESELRQTAALPKISYEKKCAEDIFRAYEISTRYDQRDSSLSTVPVMQLELQETGFSVLEMYNF